MLFFSFLLLSIVGLKTNQIRQELVRVNFKEYFLNNKNDVDLIKKINGLNFTSLLIKSIFFISF